MKLSPREATHPAIAEVLQFFNAKGLASAYKRKATMKTRVEASSCILSVRLKEVTVRRSVRERIMFRLHSSLQSEARS